MKDTPETKPTLKKQWQKPDFYILDTNKINGGGPADNYYEIHNGYKNFVHAKGAPANIAPVPASAYAAFHS